MTPTSTDRFRRGIIATVVVLAVLCAGFVVLNYFQGPKLASATVDTTQVVHQANQQLRLFSNQNVAKISATQVSVSPVTPFTVTSQGQVVAVQFSTRLDYATHYSVTVKGVHSIYQSQEGTFRYSFTTVPASVYYLDRADPSKAGGALDQIVTTGLHGTKRSVVYSAAKIQDFVVFPAAIAVVTLNDDFTDSLSLVSLNKGHGVENLLLPGPGTIDKLQSEPDAGVLGFVFSSAGGSATPEFSQDLMEVDLTAAHAVTPVLGLDSKPLSVLDWTFLSGTTSIVAQAYDQSVLLIDPKNPKSSTPLGIYSALLGSSPDGKSIVVADVFSPLLLTIATAKSKRLETNQIGGGQTFGGALALTGSGTTNVQQVAVFDDTSGEYASYLVLQEGAKSRILFGSKDYKGSIDGFSISPNGQYLAVEVVPDYATSTSDGYFINPRATSITTDYIDIATGAVIRSVAGFATAW